KLDCTLFRYPLRTIQDSKDSEISKNEYNPSKILEMFDKFYENESINCLLFLKYVENIKFFELKENETIPKLLYSIEIVNAKQICKKRRLIAERIVSLMKELDEKKLSGNTALESMFIATFRQQKNDEKPQESEWIIFSMLGDLNTTANHFQETFKKNLIDYKLIPNVGIAVQLNNPEAIGKLFCFLPLPISIPFRVSLHGHFAVSTNRRSLWSAADGEDLAEGTLAKLKVSWNEYLFNNIIPQAWAKFLIQLDFEVPSIEAKEIYSFWPIIKESKSRSFVNNQCNKLLLNTIENFNIKDKVFCGPPKSCSLGDMTGILPSYSKVQLSCGNLFHILSIENGFLPDESANLKISNILESIGFPMIKIDPKIYEELKKSKHKKFLNICSPHFVRMYLLNNKSRWENQKRDVIISLFEYVLRDKNYTELEGLAMIPLSDGTFGTILQPKKFTSYFGIIPKSKNLIAYIGPDNNISIGDNDERKIFGKSLNKFIDKNIPSELWDLLYKGAREGWDLNIKILEPSVVVDLITKESNGLSTGCDEIPLNNSFDLIFKIWANFKERDYDLTEFENVHLIPTNSDTLRKLKTNQKCFWNIVDNKLDNDVQPLIERFGVIFVDKQFEKLDIYNKSKYLENLTEVLVCLRTATTFPKNVQIKLQPQEVEIMINYLLRFNSNNPLDKLIENLPIFTEVGKEEFIALEANRSWYLLPSEDEKDYGKIITPNSVGFLDATTPNKRFLLETIVKVKRLSRQDYWTKFVIPYLGSQTLETIEIVIIKLFERLPFLLSKDPNLKSILGNMAFIPTSTILNTQQRQESNIELKKPIELFDPDNKYIRELFFDNERLFPAKIFEEKFRDNFLTSLKTLGMKTCLSSFDIIKRFDEFEKRRNNEKDIVHQISLKLVQYIDKNYNRLFETNLLQMNGTSGHYILNGGFSLKLLATKWIPTVDSTGKKLFSTSYECRSIKLKNLVGFVMPIIEYTFENKSFSDHIGCDLCPPEDKVIAQLITCSSMKTIHENSSKICEAVYRYMNEWMDNTSVLAKFKEKLKDKKWIFCNDKFYSQESVVIELDKSLGSNEIIIELPHEFKPFKGLFKEMGVKQKMGVPDLINIIKGFHSTKSKSNEELQNSTDSLSNEESQNSIDSILNEESTDSVKILSNEELHKVVGVIELIANRIDEQSNFHESLEELLIPNTNLQLVNLYEIYYDDMRERLSDDDKNGLNIAHSSISYSVAKTLGMKMLAGNVIEVYEQHEQLAVRIRNIINDYSLGSIFNEFLQNADDAGARKICFIIDERDYRKSNKFSIFNLLNNKNTEKQSSLLSDEMNQWQGPALWIYNDSEFTPHDFNSIIKLGMGGKKDDRTKIGRFGVGFNCVYHLTDVPSFVSGEHIVFFDPLEKCLPKTGNPPRSRRGIKFNFIEKNFKKRFEDQAFPYAAIFGCELKEKFNGTLFRIPLRTTSSELSNQVLKPQELRNKLFENVQANRELLFLRNIEQCSLYQINVIDKLDLVWNAKIQNINDNIRERRISHSNEAKIYQLEMEMYCKHSRLHRNGKSSESWIICSGGVAALLSQEDARSPDAEKSSNIPELNGRVYSYLSLPISTSLGVHINGTFYLSTDRKNVLQADSDLLTADTKEGEWNRYILLDVLPPLHSKLLEHIANQLKLPFNGQTSTRLWPIQPSTKGIYQTYGLNVLRGLYIKRYKVFWTEANGGALIPLDKG
ncbi:10201_t:CDS:10, partial [Scutellospora calospora]